MICFIINVFVANAGWGDRGLRHGRSMQRFAWYITAHARLTQSTSLAPQRPSTMQTRIGSSLTGGRERLALGGGGHGHHPAQGARGAVQMAVLPKSGRDMTPERRAHNVLSAIPLASSSSPLSPARSHSRSLSASIPMAAVASSSKLSGSTRQRSRRDVFKPKFPLDPFAGASATALGEPWFLKIDALLSATALQRRNVVFVLGGASAAPCP